jgi:hypothetical protein
MADTGATLNRPTSPRVRHYGFTPEVFAHLGRGPDGRLFAIARGGLPGDARVVSVVYDPDRWTFVITVESAEFPEVEEGRPIPEGDVWFRTFDVGTPDRPLAERAAALVAAGVLSEDEAGRLTAGRPRMREFT